jgi:hypothetical protein
VDADGLLADEEALPDLAICAALGDEGEDIPFPGAQPEGIRTLRRG